MTPGTSSYGHRLSKSEKDLGDDGGGGGMCVYVCVGYVNEHKSDQSFH